MSAGWTSRHGQARQSTPHDSHTTSARTAIRLPAAPVCTGVAGFTRLLVVSPVRRDDDDEVQVERGVPLPHNGQAPFHA